MNFPRLEVRNLRAIPARWSLRVFGLNFFMVYFFVSFSRLKNSGF